MKWKLVKVPTFRGESTASIFRDLHSLWTYKTWRGREYISPKRRQQFTTQYDMIYKKTRILVTTAVRNSNSAVMIAFISTLLRNIFPRSAICPCCYMFLILYIMHNWFKPRCHRRGNFPFSRLPGVPKKQRAICHAPYKTTLTLSCLAVKYAVGSPAFKSVVTVPNRLVCFGVSSD